MYTLPAWRSILTNTLTRAPRFPHAVHVLMHSITDKDPEQFVQWLISPWSSYSSPSPRDQDIDSSGYASDMISHWSSLPQTLVTGYLSGLQNSVVHPTETFPLVLRQQGNATSSRIWTDGWLSSNPSSWCPMSFDEKRTWYISKLKKEQREESDPKPNENG